jgi:hypothetical protein
MSDFLAFQKITNKANRTLANSTKTDKKEGFARKSTERKTFKIKPRFTPIRINGIFADSEKRYAQTTITKQLMGMKISRGTCREKSLPTRKPMVNTTRKTKEDKKSEILRVKYIQPQTYVPQIYDTRNPYLSFIS